jgi:hypothetical protein
MSRLNVQRESLLVNAEPLASEVKLRSLNQVIP